MSPFVYIQHVRDGIFKQTKEAPYTDCISRPTNEARTQNPLDNHDTGTRLPGTSRLPVSTNGRYIHKKYHIVERQPQFFSRLQNPSLLLTHDIIGRKWVDTCMKAATELTVVSW